MIGKYRKPDSISDIEYRLMVVPEEILTSEQHGILHQATRGESDIVYARHFYDYSGDEYTLIYRRGDGIDSNGEVMKENGSRIFVVTNGLIAKGHIDHDEIRQLDRSGLEEAFQRTNETFVQMWEQGGVSPAGDDAQSSISNLEVPTRNIFTSSIPSFPPTKKHPSPRKRKPLAR